jgi:diguanylate cyclase (GGDEF)-like protein/PAS domain S-box-containing protein
MQSPENYPDRSSRQVDGLKRLAQVVNAYSSQEQALAEALKIVAEVMQVEKCLLMRHDPKTNRLLPVTPYFGFELSQLSQLQVNLIDPKPLRSDCQVFSLAFLQGRAVYSNQPHTFEAFQAEEKLKVQNALVAPVVIQGEVQGVCAVMDRQEGAFDEGDCDLLAALAAIMSSLLKNLNLINRLEEAQRRHLAVLDAAVDGFVEVNRDFRITLFSKGAESLTGWKAEQALGHTCSEVLLPHTPQGELLCHNCPLQRAFKHNTSVSNVETLVRTREGEDNWVSCSYNVVTDEQGELVSGVIAVKDIYRIKALTDELRQQIQQQESLLGVINAINGISNIEEIYSKALGEVASAINFDLGMIHSINELDELELMAISRSEPEPAPENRNPLSNYLPPVSESEDGPFIQNPIAHFDPDAGESDFRRFNRPRRSENSGPVLSGRNYISRATYELKTIHDCEALRQNEPYMAVNLPGKEICGVLEGFENIQSHLCVPIKTQEHTYGVLHLASHHPYAFWGSDFALALSICKQIAVAAERAHLFEEVDRLARTDPLTKLYNKREFWDRIEREIKRAERQRRPLSLMVIDLDRLKWYNDFYGHTHGDILLAHIGKLVMEKCRNTDIAFRYGGDELCLLLPDTGPREAFMVAERIRQSAIELQIVLGDEVIIGAEEESRVTMSIGVACFPGDATSGVELFENADSAMYRAKETGKNRSVMFDPAVDINKLNYRRRVRPSEYIDDRLKPPVPNPPQTLPPMLNNGQQITLPLVTSTESLNDYEVEVGEELIFKATGSRPTYSQENEKSNGEKA